VYNKYNKISSLLIIISYEENNRNPFLADRDFFVYFFDCGRR